MRALCAKPLTHGAVASLLSSLHKCRFLPLGLGVLRLLQNGTQAVDKKKGHEKQVLQGTVQWECPKTGAELWKSGNSGEQLWIIASRQTKSWEDTTTECFTKFYLLFDLMLFFYEFCIFQHLLWRVDLYCVIEVYIKKNNLKRDFMSLF